MPPKKGSPPEEAKSGGETASKKAGTKAETASAKKADSAKTAAPATSSQVLPSKEAAMFKQILRFYETKQYKKGIKTADAILAKFPTNGETLAMKGLIMNGMGKKADAQVLVKKGLAMNIKSHVCWHVYGLWYRADHAYNDAIKCYQNAIRIDPSNNEILKDLSLLQIQRRMTEGFAETRRKILMLKTSNRNNWIAYALGNHLSGKYKKAIAIIDAFAATVDARKMSKNFEHSEMLLYKNMVIEESGDLNAALKHLAEIKDDVMDNLGWLEKIASLSLGLKKPAVDTFGELLKVNSENYWYHYGLACTLGILEKPEPPSKYTDEQIVKLTELYDQLGQKFTDSTACVRIPLNFLTGSAFEAAVTKHLTKAIRKGIPSLFRDLKSLYTDPAKVQCISSLISSIVQQLREHNRFSADQPADSEAPSAIVWAWYFQVQHLDFLGAHAQAFEVCDVLIKHTPTNLDAYMLKARLLKHVGEYQLAHTYMDQARRMDTADRYLNTKCTRYALRADSVPIAEETVSLFLRDGDNLGSLFDMQCSWYENECGETYAREREYAKALKQFVNVTKHFRDMEEDQFDFHSYCLRKMTLRAYVKMMRMEDHLKSHRFFVRACEGVINTYIRVYDEKKAEEAAAVLPDADPRAAKLAEKKARKQAREAEKKKAEEAGKKAKDESKARKGREEDDDPDGEKLLAKDSLSEASSYAKELLLYSYDTLKSHLLAGEVFSRRKKYLLWLRSLKHAHGLNPSHAEVLHQRFRLILATEREAEMNAMVRQVIEVERPWLGLSSAAVLDEMKSRKQQLGHAFVLAKSMIAVDPNATPAAMEVLCNFTADPSISIKQCTHILNYLEEIHPSHSVVFKEKCGNIFTCSPQFMSAATKDQFASTHAFQDPLLTEHSLQ